MNEQLALCKHVRDRVTTNQMQQLSGTTLVVRTALKPIRAKQLAHLYCVSQSVFSQAKMIEAS